MDKEEGEKKERIKQARVKGREDKKEGEKEGPRLMQTFLGDIPLQLRSCS